MHRKVEGCLSCKILAGRCAPPGGVIYEDDYWHVDSAASPVLWRGFPIIKLKRHCEHLAELTPEAVHSSSGPKRRSRRRDYAAAMGSGEAEGQE